MLSKDVSPSLLATFATGFLGLPTPFRRVRRSFGQLDGQSLDSWLWERSNSLSCTSAMISKGHSASLLLAKFRLVRVIIVPKLAGKGD
jgi:hypothetical protein